MNKKEERNASDDGLRLGGIKNGIIETAICHPDPFPVQWNHQNKSSIGIEKTQEEIDRMWKYNAMMGRGLSWLTSTL